MFYQIRSVHSFCHGLYNNFTVRCEESNIFCYDGNKGQSKANFNNTVKLPALKNPLFDATLSTTAYLLHKPSYSQFCVKIRN